MHTSNLPTDPEGRIKKAPGRTPGTPNKLPSLVRENIVKVFEELGGVKGMVDWCNASPRNLYAFYCMVYPKVMGTQPRLTFYANKPQITRIETVIVDPVKAPS